MNIKDIKGQEHVKRAIEVALAGQHSALLTGPSGWGKSLFCEWVIEKAVKENYLCPSHYSHSDLPVSPTWFEGSDPFWFLAESWPCECGNYTHPHNACFCEVDDLRYFRSKLQATAGYADICIEVPPFGWEKLWAKRDGESDERVLERVRRAREAAATRQGKPNGELEFWELKELVKLDQTGENLIKAAFSQLSLSPRQVHSVLKVCLTIFDLSYQTNKDDRPHVAHLAEAIQYRSRVELPLEVKE